MKRHLFLSFLVLLIVAACSVDPKPELGENDEKYLSFYEGLIIDGSIVTKDSLLNIHLPLVVINTKDGEMPSFEKVQTPEGCWGNGIKNAKLIPGRMVFVDKGKVLFDSEADSIKIKVRGNTTAYEEKKPYKIKLSSPKDLLFRGDEKRFADKDWCLIKDEALLAKIGFYLGELLSMEWTPGYRYINLVLNNCYLGPYMLIESVDKNETCRLNVDDSGGVLEYDAYWWNEDYYIESPLLPYPLNYTFKYPNSDKLKEGDKQYFTTLINSFEESLYDGTWPEVIEAESFVNWILCHDILGTGDSGGTNMFLLKYDRSESTKIKMPVLWDFGKALFMKNQWSESHGSGCFVYGPLFQDSVFISLYKNRWSSLHEEVIKKMCDFLDGYKGSEEIIAYETSVLLNNMIWNTSTTRPTLLVDDYVEWFKNREIWLMESIDKI